MLDLLECTIVIPDKRAIVECLEGKRAEKVAALTFARSGVEVRITGVVPLKNTHPHPANNYAVSAHQLRRFDRNNFILVHSHPKEHHQAGPSPEDIEGLSTRYGGVYIPGIKLLVLYTRNATRTLSLK